MPQLFLGEIEIIFLVFLLLKTFYMVPPYLSKDLIWIRDVYNVFFVLNMLWSRRTEYIYMFCLYTGIFVDVYIYTYIYTYVYILYTSNMDNKHPQVSPTICKSEWHPVTLWTCFSLLDGHATQKQLQHVGKCATWSHCVRGISSTLILALWMIEAPSVIHFSPCVY